MEPTNDILKRLDEIRDIQREHLAEYKRNAARAIELQERAVARQAAGLTLYKMVLLVGAIIITGGVVPLAYVYSR